MYMRETNDEWSVGCEQFKFIFYAFKSKADNKELKILCNK